MLLPGLQNVTFSSKIDPLPAGPDVVYKTGTLFRNCSKDLIANRWNSVQHKVLSGTKPWFPSAVGPEMPQ